MNKLNNVFTFKLLKIYFFLYEGSPIKIKKRPKISRGIGITKSWVELRG